MMYPAHMIHFSLILLDYPHSFYHLLFGREVQHLELHYILDRFSLFAIIPIGIYLYLTYNLVRRYNEQLPNYFSNTYKIRLKWLGNSIIGWACLFMLAFVYAALDFIYDFNFEPASVVNFIFMSTILWLGWRGINQGENTFDIPVPPDVDGLEEGGKSVISQLDSVMEEQKLFLIPDLTLRQVEDQTGISSKDISLVLNQLVQKNFYQYINDFRVKEFIRKATNGRNSHLTLFGIAQESGFSSKATFNRVFKSSMGLPPKEYLSQEENKTSQ